MTGAIRLRSKFGSADDSPGFLLWRVANGWQAAQREALEPYGLTHVQFVLLAAATWLSGEEPVTQRNVADFAGTDPMMTSQVLRTLEGKELIRRSRHPADGRAMALSVTVRGAALVNRAIAAVEACDDAYFEPLGPSRLVFTTALKTLSRSKRAPARPGPRSGPSPR
jgi:DNA-binding MarR family transcriptional regulator